MRLSAPRKRRSIVGLTSLIDVIFLLLLFFMLSSTFSRYSQLDLGVAGVGSGSGGERPKLIMSLSDDSVLRLNGRVTELGGLDAALEPFLAEGVERAVIVPRGDVSLQELVALLETVKSSKLKSVSLAN
nr:biopolymer transporter ExbD [uncultured Cohaesibacter sp.]